MNKFKSSLEQNIIEEKIYKMKNKYSVRNRVSSWRRHARYYFDDYLDKLEQAMLRVFCEDNPKYDLDKEQRQYSNILGVGSRYSDTLREGLATTLAIIGNYADELVNCSQSKREQFASIIVHKTLSSASWKRLVSLNNILPLFAEASPDAFLEEMDAISSNVKMISELQAEEGDLFSGSFHWTGIVWALETLAWSPMYLLRVVKILAQLAEVEGKSNYHPQPSDALAEILLPWFPQTISTKEKIVAAAGVLSKQHPYLGWRTLTSSLECVYSSGSPLPKIRQILPKDYKNEPSKKSSMFIYLKKEYMNILLGIAVAHQDLLDKLVVFLPHLRGTDFFEKALQVLSSCNFQLMVEQSKEVIWTKLRKLTLEHKKHKNAKWAFSAEEIQKIEQLLPLYMPNSTIYQVKYLFDKFQSDWYFSNKYEDEEQQFAQNQIAAVGKLFQESQLEGIFQLTEIVDCPIWVGLSTGKARIDISINVLETLLEKEEAKYNEFLDGYLKQVFYEDKEGLINKVENSTWNQAKKVSFLLHLPFCASVWSLVEKWLGDAEALYWEKCVFEVGYNEHDFGHAVFKALQHNNVLLALNCVLWNTHYGTETDTDLAIKMLIMLANSEELKQVNKWHITQIIKGLQSKQLTNTQFQEMLQIEFLFLPLLDSHVDHEASPIFLEKAISTDPSFFHQIICSLYKSEKDGWQNPYSLPETSKSNLYLLLRQWSKIPGLDDNNNFDFQQFKKWYDAVMTLCKESGHVPRAQYAIGEVLRNIPKDDSGLWINKNIAELLNEKDNEELRSGFYISVFNSRGAHIIDFTGKEEKELASQYCQKADELEADGLFTFALTLRSIAESYEREAKENINEAKNRFEETSFL